jgi:hypothetical protein
MGQSSLQEAAAVYNDVAVKNTPGSRTTVAEVWPVLPAGVPERALSPERSLDASFMESFDAGFPVDPGKCPSASWRDQTTPDRQGNALRSGHLDCSAGICTNCFCAEPFGMTNICGTAWDSLY